MRSTTISLLFFIFYVFVIREGWAGYILPSSPPPVLLNESVSFSPSYSLLARQLHYYDFDLPTNASFVSCLLTRAPGFEVCGLSFYLKLVPASQPSLSQYPSETDNNAGGWGSWTLSVNQSVTLFVDPQADVDVR